MADSLSKKIEELVRGGALGILRYGDSDAPLIRVLALIPGTQIKEEILRLAEQRVELRCLPVELFEKAINEDRDRFLVPAMAQGEVLFEADGNRAFSDLRRLALSAFLDGPKKLLQAHERDAVRWRLTRRLQNVLELNPEAAPVDFQLETTRAVETLVEGYVTLSGIWGGNGVFGLSRKDPYLSALVNSILVEPDPTKRLKLLESAYDYALKPFGGRLYQHEMPLPKALRSSNILAHPFRFLKAAAQNLLGVGDASAGRYGVLIRFMGFLYPRRWNFVAIGCGNLVVALLTLAAAVMTKLLFDAAFSKLDMGLARLILIGILAAAVLQAFMTFSVQYYSAWVEWKIWYELQREFYRRLLAAPFRFLEESRTGDVVFRFNDAEAALQLSTQVVLDLLQSGVMLAVMTVACFILNWRLTLFALAGVPLFVLSYQGLNHFIRTYTDPLVKQKALVTAKQYEVLASIREIQGAARESYFLRRMRLLLLELFRRDLLLKAIVYGFTRTNDVLAISAFLFLLGGTAYSVLQGTMTLGDASALFVLCAQLVRPIRTLLALGPVIQRDLVRAQRFFDTFEKAGRPVSEGGKRLQRLEGEYRLEKVGFKGAGGVWALRNLSLEIDPGNVLAVMGTSGAGKTALLSLLLGFYLPEEGRARVDGKELSELDLKAYRSFIGYLPAQTVVFEGDLIQNVLLGRFGFGENVVLGLLRQVGLGDTLRRLPNGGRTPLGERGTELSEGERRRLGIARALLGSPGVLMLDDPTAGLDEMAQQAVAEYLGSLRGRATVVVATQSPILAAAADRILVLRRGEIAEEGAYAALNRAGTLFHALYAT